jgi:hypothetical protein
VLRKGSPQRTTYRLITLGDVDLAGMFKQWWPRMDILEQSLRFKDRFRLLGSPNPGIPETKVNELFLDKASSA